MLDKMYDLSDNYFKHLVASQDALKPCVSCEMDKDGHHKPGRAKNEAGRCRFCDGKYVVPDLVQRNWANTMIADRIVPPPKSVELQVDDKREYSELEQKASSLSNEELDKQLKAIGALEIL